MIHPSFKEFKQLSKRGNLVALRSDLPSDLETPVSAFLKLAAKKPCAFLFESAEQEERIGRYSFLGFDPESVLFVQRGNVYLKEGKRSTRLGSDQKLMEIMRRRMAGYRLVNQEGLPNFTGGFVGFLGYENVRNFENLSLSEKNGLSLEDAVFFWVKSFVLFDHFKRTLSLISLCEIPKISKAGLEALYRKSISQLVDFERKIQRTLMGFPLREKAKKSITFNSNIGGLEFQRKMKRVKEYIRAGDCIQVVLSQRFCLGKVDDDFEIYRALHSINPSPYMFYFRYGSLRLIGSSPELLVKKTGRDVEVRPIAGTRPRGQNEEEDIRAQENLKRSVKEMAEHLMLVDLGRNDLGRVCDFKTVRVDDFARVEKYSHVMHLVSSVMGRLKTKKDCFDLLKATFPSGTVTGAPKIRAMQIIDELESEKRGSYAGCMGYFSLNHDMDMCITIRTIVVVEGQAYVQAGAGIVYDSQPSREYMEIVNKAKALVQAVQGRATWVS